MARVRLNKTEDLPPDDRWLFERLEKDPMGLLNIYRALSHSPEALRRFMKFGRYFLAEGKLDPKLREVAILRAGFLCRAPYEVSQHISFGRRVGLTDDQIRALAHPEGGPFDERERAIIAYATEMTDGAQVSDATHAAVASFLDDEQVVELTMVVGFYNLVSRTLNALRVELDPPAQRDLDALGVEV
jgi:alkylhydroperoxidase family enzyme